MPYEENKEMEFKIFKWELKELTQEGTFSGYASVFGNVDSYNDIIEKTAFNQTIKGDRQRPLFYLHDPMSILGITNLKVDDYGLHTIGKFNMAVQFARDMYEYAKQGVLGALSIGFSSVKFEYDKIKNVTVRRLKELKLYEVSLLPKRYAANPKAFVTELKNRRFTNINEDDIINQIKLKINDKFFIDRIKTLFDEPSKDIQTQESLEKKVMPANYITLLKDLKSIQEVLHEQRK